MLASPGRRFLTVGFLVLIMFIPQFFAAEVIQSRKDYSASTIESVSSEWGGPQVITGPVMVIPVEQRETIVTTRRKLDPVTGAQITNADGQPIFERVEEIEWARTDPVYMYPDQFDVVMNTASEVRSRGIFRVPVYRAEARFDFDFVPEEAEIALADDERLLWDQARIRVSVSNNKALRGAARLTADARELMLEPASKGRGFSAHLGDPRGTNAYALELGLNGAGRLLVAPVGRTSTAEMVSDWPHPSFTGAFLPDRSEISEAGFTANWTIPHLARALPQIARESHQSYAHNYASFGVEFIEPNDFYQKAYRAARYGLLFIALTFLTVVLIERGTHRPVHPVQYILIGLVQTLFVLLMVAYAEHLGFGAAYLLASAAVIALLTLYGYGGLKLGKRALVLGAMLMVVYALLYLILRSADFALLAGSSVAFVALALTMYATRNEEWYSDGAERKPGLFARLRNQAASAAVPEAPVEKT